jgi:hypothetical protein
MLGEWVLYQGAIQQQLFRGPTTRNAGKRRKGNPCYTAAADRYPLTAADVAQASRPARKFYVQLLRRPGGLRHVRHNRGRADY